MTKTIEQLEVDNVVLREALKDLSVIAELIELSAWRTLGGDDGQGHYEGEIWAEKMLCKATAALSSTTDYSNKVVVVDKEELQDLLQRVDFTFDNYMRWESSSQFQKLRHDVTARLDSIRGGEK